MKRPTTETVILVNAQDHPIGTAEKLAVHRQGLLHRAFSIFIFNDKQQLLLQQRHPDKYHCGGLWTNSCCSHPRPDESTMAAAQRRLQEELGFSTTLQHIGEFIYRAEFDNGLIEHEYDHVFVGHYAQPVTHFDRSEIAALRWVNLDSLQQELTDHPKRFTPWFAQALGVAVNAP